MQQTQFRTIDALMGQGKTTLIINELKAVPSNSNQRYIFITPYNDEVERITKAAPHLKFVTPSDETHSTKLNSFHDLVAAGHNIVSTHELFKRWSDETLMLLSDFGYHLIIDEVVDCVRQYGTSKDDKPDSVMLCRDTGTIQEDDKNYLRWKSAKSYSSYNSIKRDCDQGRLILLPDKKDGLFFWEFPIVLLKAFHSVTILTYMFDASYMAAYLRSHNVEPERLTLDQNGKLVPWSEEHERVAIEPLARLINIIEDDKLNALGDEPNALSSSWFSKTASSKDKRQLGKNVRNFFEHRSRSTSKDERMWSCVEAVKDSISPPHNAKTFVSCNLRATNKHKGCNSVAYLRNIFPTPTMARYFKERSEVSIDSQRYALAEFLQWLFRSAIRDGKPVDVYLPSKRMRNIVKSWMNDERAKIAV
ncbi:hypothetical protein [Litoribrevibacter euphylliae]